MFYDKKEREEDIGPKLLKHWLDTFTEVERKVSTNTEYWLEQGKYSRIG